MFDNTEFGNISFDLPKNQSNVIKVIGVGGGGSNAINYMFKQGIKGVDFIVCNTDSQALENSPVPVKIQLGVSLTEGLGAGANPEVGKYAAEESKNEIEQMLGTNTKMLFITAGMGGGTGTGAAPMIAEYARNKQILTVGIVTIPFQFEGKVRMEQALFGIEKLRKQVDSLIVINNNKLREVYGNLGFKAGFAKADEVLATASKGIAEVITHHYTQNIDLKDVKTVLSDSGSAIMGSAKAKGEYRAKEAIVSALDSPLLNDNKITGAKNVLLLIVSGTEEITMDEIAEINEYIQAEAGNNANIIMGVGEDENLADEISVTIIATGFNVEQQDALVNVEQKKTIFALENDQLIIQDLLNKTTITDFTVSSPINEQTKVDRVVFDLQEEVAPVAQAVTEVKEVQEPLVPTTDYIAAIKVDYTAVINPEEFIITSVNPTEVEVHDPEYVTKDANQITLAFDSPIVTTQETVVSENTLITISDYIKNIQVTDAIHVVPVTEINNNGFIKYSLEDYVEPQQTRNTQVKAVVQELKPEVPELDFSFKVVENKATENPIVEKEEFLSTEMTIEETLRLSSENRRKKMKDFNYKFASNASQVDDFEKEPAYKRMGLDLSEDASRFDSKKSRMSFGTDGKDDFQFRSNNSFLHDNVD
jgi:cell division protein FtsZ